MLIILNPGDPKGYGIAPLNTPLGTPRVFADDTCLVIHATNPIILSGKINLELQKASEWTEANKITVNPNNSHVLIIPPQNTQRIPSVKVDNT